MRAALATLMVLASLAIATGSVAAEALSSSIEGRPDPYIFHDEGSSFLYSTRTPDLNVPVTYETAPGSFETIEALPEVPEWSNGFFVWAPAVERIGDRYLLYYTTRHVESGHQCISVARSRSPIGPFVDTSTEPLICQHEAGGSIDPSPIRDADGSLHLLFKNDGNCCGLPVSIYSQELSRNGKRVVGEPALLLTADREWEGGIIEGPSMIAVDNGRYLLSYSASKYWTADYTTGFAFCLSVTGPCSKIGEPWALTDPDLVGTGGLEMSRTAGTDSITLVYHGWPPDEVGADNARATRIRTEIEPSELFCVAASSQKCPQQPVAQQSLTRYSNHEATIQISDHHRSRPT